MNRAHQPTLESLEPRCLLSFGQPDAGFGVNGRGRIEFASGSSYASPTEMLVDSSSRIVTVSDGGIVRFTAAGVPDSSFGVGGRVALTGLTVRDAAFDSSGKIVILASGTSGNLILRFTTAGKSDKPFGTNGAALVTANRKFIGNTLAIDSQGRFVIAGYLRNTTEQSSKGQVYRLTSAGATDTGFDGDGIADVQLGSTDLLNPVPIDSVVNVAIGAGDSITVLGGSQAFSPGGYDSDTGNYFDSTYGDAQLVAARLTSGGSLDGNFGAGGFARHTYFSGRGIAYAATAGIVQANGSIALASVSTNNRLVVDRFSSSGQFVREDSPGALRLEQTFRQDMAELPDGRLIMAALNLGGSDRGFAVFTLTDDGTTGPIVRPSTEKGTTLFSTYQQPAQIAVFGDDLIASGLSPSSSYAQNVIKFDAGSLTDSPDHRPAGGASDLAIDAAGGTHLAYYDTAHQSLVYVYRDPSGVWGSPRTIDGNARTGEQLSIAIGKNYLPSIAYYDGKNGDLKLAQYTSKKKWVLTLVDSKGTTGQSPSLAINPNTNQPAIAYYYKNGTTLRFATIENDAWAYENVDTKKAGQFNSLVFTPKSKVPSIAYSDSSGNLKYGTRPKAGKWTLSSVAAGVGAAYVDMTYGGYSNYAAISYYNATSADLALATFNGSTGRWVNRTLASSGAQGQYTHVYAPYGSALYVLSYNRSKDRVDLFTTDWDDPTSTTSTTIDTSFGRSMSFGISPSTGAFLVGGFDTTNADLQLIDGYIA